MFMRVFVLVMTTICGVTLGDVRAAGTLSVSFSGIPTGAAVDLTAQGPLDWVHWGLFTETTIDRKANVAPQISDFTVVDAPNGYAYAYQYGDNWNGYAWSDGAPHPTITNTTTGVWIYGTPLPGSGFALSVPASTNVQVLRVYVGAFAAEGKFTATLSDGSAPGYVNGPAQTVSNAGNGPSSVYAITFSAASAGQLLRITYTLERFSRPDGNVTLQAAALSAPGANNPPYIALIAPAAGASYAGPTNVTLIASASDADGTIERVSYYDGTNQIGESTASPYSIIWTNPLPGSYSLTARAVDNAGAVSISAPVDVFISSSLGSLSGSRASAPLALDLTAEGTSDWTHWGLTAPADFNHKAGGGGISNIGVIGTNAVHRYIDNRTAFSWSDGTPVAAVNNTNAGIFITGLTNGFQFTAPADTNTHTLRVYCGVYGAKASFEAWLSDFSGRAFTDTSLSNVYGNSYAVYTLTYAAASPGQHLTVRYRVRNVFDSDFGNITLAAATLQGAIAPAPGQVLLLAPTVQGGVMRFSFATEPGRSYAVQRSELLPAATWQTFTNASGTGTSANIADPATASQQFYRVLVQ